MANNILRDITGQFDPADKKAAAQFFNAIRKRKAVVQHSSNKLEIAKQIADKSQG